MNIEYIYSFDRIVIFDYFFRKTEFILHFDRIVLFVRLFFLKFIFRSNCRFRSIIFRKNVFILRSNRPFRSITFRKNVFILCFESSFSIAFRKTEFILRSDQIVVFMTHRVKKRICIHIYILRIRTHVSDNRFRSITFRKSEFVYSSYIEYTYIYTSIDI